MGKKYEPVPDAMRHKLIHLIYNKGMNISKASKELGIYYPTAKAINKIYVKQGRVIKRTNRDRMRRPAVQITVAPHPVMSQSRETFTNTHDSPLHPLFKPQDLTKNL